ncbi:MAG: GNAT family protein [bacterium]
MNEITLREATMDDCDDLYRWRNDPVTREQFFESEVVPYEEHQKWFRKAMDDSNRLFFIGVDEKGEKCGVVRFDIKDGVFAEISVNVAPEKRGKKIGPQLISRSCPLFFLKTKRRLILARTKEQNIASIKAFKKAGFSELFRYNDTTRGGVVAFVLLAPYVEVE